MSTISTLIAQARAFVTTLRSSIWAIDVRDGIADSIQKLSEAIEQCYSDVSNPTLQTEALEAALQNKIDEGEMAALTIGDHTITAAKLAQGVIDNTLATSGAAADAAETGRQFGLIKADLDALEPGLSNEAKAALIACFNHVMWDGDGAGQIYIDTLKAEIGVVDNPFEDASYELGAWGYNYKDNPSSGCVVKNDTLTTRVRTVVPVSCRLGRITAKTGYEINMYMLNSQSYGEWSTPSGISMTGYNDMAYVEQTTYYQWGTQKEILTGTNYVLVVVRKTSNEAFTQQEAENIYGTGFEYEEATS